MLDLEKLEKEKKENNRTWCVLQEQMEKEKDTRSFCIQTLKLTEAFTDTNYILVDVYVCRISHSKRAL